MSRSEGEYLSTDKNYLVRGYRYLVGLLEGVEVGEVGIEEFKAGIYSYIYNILPNRFVYDIVTGKRLIPTFEEQEMKYVERDRRREWVLELTVTDEHERRRRKDKIALDRKVAVGDSILRYIKQVLEDRPPKGLGIMNVFDSDSIEGTGKPVL